MIHLTKEVFGKTNTGIDIIKINLQNDSGFSLDLLNYGARMQAIWMPDRNGHVADLLQASDLVEDLLRVDNYYGAVCGPFANRIAEGQVLLNDKIYQLPQNEGSTCLHSGPHGFHRRIWDYQIKEQGVVFSLAFEADEEGFPGAFTCDVEYSLSEDNVIRLDYTVHAAETCLFSPTNHAYFNLAGEATNSLDDHFIRINADFYTPIDKASLVTGEVRQVADSAWDLRSESEIARLLSMHADDLKASRGYDHNFILNKNEIGELCEAALLYHAKSGRALRVSTTQVGLQFYTANYPPKFKGKNQLAYTPQSAVCLETQGVPNSPRHTHLPSAWVAQGTSHTERTEYAFSIRN